MPSGLARFLPALKQRLQALEAERGPDDKLVQSFRIVIADVEAEERSPGERLARKRGGDP